jgi:hypothetical protein
MPQYFFTVRTGNGDPPERAAELSDDAAALAYACEIVRELGQSLAHIDRSLVKVRDETRQMVFLNSVPRGVRLKTSTLRSTQITFQVCHPIPLNWVANSVASFGAR